MIEEVDASRAPLMDHLVELRRRLIWSVAALGLAFGVCFYFAGDIFGFLVQPLIAGFGGPGRRGRIVYTKLYEAFFTECGWHSLPPSSSPFRYRTRSGRSSLRPLFQGKAGFLPFLIQPRVLFTLGAALAYYVVMPRRSAFVLGYRGRCRIQQESAAARGGISSLRDALLLPLGILPCYPSCDAAGGAGIVHARAAQGRPSLRASWSPSSSRGRRRPPDVLSQFMLAVPLILLYELSLIAIWFTERRRRVEPAPKSPDG
jgi:sec-independent protein translocase protein TatC